MCDGCERIAARWKGWLPIPPRRRCEPAGDWIDLSHQLREDLDRVSLVPPPTFRKLSTLPAHPNVTDMHMVVHIGTHVDAPCHFVIDGPAAQDVPLDRLHGAGVVWRMDVEPLAEIDVSHLERATPKMQRGDIVLISTGWAKHINTPMYEDHPALTVAAAEWLVAKGAKMIGVDFSTPDLTVHRRPEGFTWPVHQVLLANGVLIAEHIANLDALENTAIEAMFLGLNIQDSDGMPARAIARRIRA